MLEKASRNPLRLDVRLRRRSGKKYGSSFAAKIRAGLCRGAATSFVGPPLSVDALITARQSGFWMKEPTLKELQQAFQAHGVKAPAEYVWLVRHRTLGFD